MTCFPVSREEQIPTGSAGIWSGRLPLLVYFIEFIGVQLVPKTTQVLSVGHIGTLQREPIAQQSLFRSHRHIVFINDVSNVADGKAFGLGDGTRQRSLSGEG